MSAVVSDDAVDRVKHLVEYLSCRVFGQAMYRHVILNLLKEAVACFSGKLIAKSLRGFYEKLIEFRGALPTPYWPKPRLALDISL